MTADEIRALEVQVVKAMGWTAAQDADTGLWYLYSRDGRLKSSGWTSDGGIWWQFAPHFITDPAAPAEVKRECFRRDWSCQSQVVTAAPPERVFAWAAYGHGKVFTQDGSIYRATEELKEHDGDPVRAEATALAKAFLQACRATGATATTETTEPATAKLWAEQAAGQKEGESGN